MAKRKPKWKLSNYRILGYLTEELRIGTNVEYRLKNSNGDIWETIRNQVFRVVTSRPFAKALREAGISLRTGWTDQAVSPYEEFVFEFTVTQAPTVLSILKFPSLDQIKEELETPRQELVTTPLGSTPLVSGDGK